MGTVKAKRVFLGLLTVGIAGFAAAAMAHQHCVLWVSCGWENGGVQYNGFCVSGPDYEQCACIDLDAPGTGMNATVEECYSGGR